MADYLSPSIGLIIPQLDQTCEDLVRQTLVRSLTQYTKELCESDPELADILLEGSKTLPRCIRYILEQSQLVVAKNVEAMMEEEFHMLDEMQVRGRKAIMAGAAVSDEQVFQWAKDYYYGGKEIEPTDKRRPAVKKDATTAEKKSAAGKTPAKRTSASSQKNSVQAAPAEKAKVVPSEMGKANEGVQLSLNGFASVSDSAA